MSQLRFGEEFITRQMLQRERLLAAIHHESRQLLVQESRYRLMVEADERKEMGRLAADVRRLAYIAAMGTEGTPIEIEEQETLARRELVAEEPPAREAIESLAEPSILDAYERLETRRIAYATLQDILFQKQELLLCDIYNEQYNEHESIYFAMRRSLEKVLMIGTWRIDRREETNIRWDIEEEEEAAFRDVLCRDIEMMLRTGDFSLFETKYAADLKSADEKEQQRQQQQEQQQQQQQLLLAQQEGEKEREQQQYDMEIEQLQSSWENTDCERAAGSTAAAAQHERSEMPQHAMLHRKKSVFSRAAPASFSSTPFGLRRIAELREDGESMNVLTMEDNDNDSNNNDLNQSRLASATYSECDHDQHNRSGSVLLVIGDKSFHRVRKQKQSALVDPAASQQSCASMSSASHPLCSVAAASSKNSLSEERFFSSQLLVSRANSSSAAAASASLFSSRGLLPAATMIATAASCEGASKLAPQLIEQHTHQHSIPPSTATFRLLSAAEFGLKQRSPDSLQKAQARFDKALAMLS